MEIFFTRPWFKVLSEFLTNLAAAWFAVAFITPNFASILSFQTIFVLIFDIIFGIVFLFAAVKIEEVLE